MSKFLQKYGSLSNIAKMTAGLRASSAAMPTSGGDPFLRLLKTGKWVRGQENVQVAEGALLMLNAMDCKHGWACWTADNDPKKVNELLGEVMVTAYAPLPPCPEDIFKDGRQWSFAPQRSITVKDLEGLHPQMMYKTGSVGGLRAFAGLIDEMTLHNEREEAKAEEAEAIGVDYEPFINPIVKLGHSSYPHKKFGEVLIPIIDIVGWADIDGNLPPKHAIGHA